MRVAAAAAAALMALIGAVPAAAPAVARGERVFLLGDSVMAGLNFSSAARAELAAAYDVTLDAKVCRAIQEPSCFTQYDGRPPAAMTVLRANSGRIGDALVMMVGYNDSNVAGGVDAVMAEANAQRVPHVVWLTYRNPNGRYSTSNATLYAKAAQYPTLTVIDWDGFTAGHRDWFAGDGLHLTAAGANGLAGFLVANLDAVFTASPPVPTRCTGAVTGTPAGPAQAVPATPAPAGGFTPVDPVRGLDTRSGAPVGAGRSVDVDLSPIVPAGATAAMVTLTATGACDAGFLTGYACGTPVPLASNVNYARGRDRANAALVVLPANRHLCVFSLATADVVVDVSGWVAPGAGWRYEPTAPTRLVDTGLVASARRAAGSTLPVAVTAWPDAPLGPTAVLVNVTATNADTAGFVTVSSCAGSRATVSTLNLGPGETVADVAAAEVSGDGTICVYTSAAMDVVVDVEGWFATVGKLLVPQAPRRLVDTRAGVGGTRLAPGATVPVATPVPGAAVVVNVTEVGADGPGFLTVYPCGPAPLASSADYRAGEVVPALAAVATDGSGLFCITSMAATDLVVDELAALAP
jgi:hypothetical protein